MADADFSLRQHLRKALDALQNEHAGEMLTPRYKRYILNNEEQADALLKHNELLVLLQSRLSRVNFIFDPIMILKDRFMSLLAYSSR